MQIADFGLKKTFYSVSFRHHDKKHSEKNFIILPDDTQIDLQLHMHSLNENNYSIIAQDYLKYKIHPFIFNIFTRGIRKLNFEQYFNFLKNELKLPLDFQIKGKSFFEYLINSWHEDVYSPSGDKLFKDPFIKAYLDKVFPNGTEILNKKNETPWMLLAYQKPHFFLTHHESNKTIWNISNKFGHNALFYLSKSPHLNKHKTDIFNSFKIDKNLVNQIDQQGNSSYFYAAANLNYFLLDHFIKSGANLNHRNKRDENILLFSALHMRPYQVQFLKFLNTLKDNHFDFSNNLKNDKQHFFNYFFNKQWFNDIIYANPYNNEYNLKLIEFFLENFPKEDYLDIKTNREKSILQACLKNNNLFIFLHLLDPNYNNISVQEFFALHKTKGKELNYYRMHDEYQHVIESMILKRQFQNQHRKIESIL